ncbi:Glycosyltransferase involved in cell wall bisynthesis [Algoriphagus ornithinivorans]|uniref:Glycosyltransferase involved in cell wall bisynthesis n=1 Tax=Algoriphagus ornithinivorans TaxID=226506 RepID=A0A1I5JN90_9BACT|nr:glycosyltransferase family 1 protein [Algoriphagus ornithinivorans]SFO74274.1 Glycosyltransferase involved in cell wall bisynthesis [Algoriphagus ornithinivorans]
MKISYDYQIFTNQSHGGISRYYAILAKELSKQNQDVRILAGFHRNSYIEGLPSDIVSGRRMDKYPKKTGRFFQLLNHGLSQVQMGVERPDIIHETYYSDWPRFKFSACRVSSVYDMIHELFSSDLSKPDRTTQLKKATFSRIDHILSISESTKSDLIKLFEIPEEKISVVHLGVDLESFQVQKRENKINRKPYLMYVGMRTSYKNFLGLMKAYASSEKLKADFDIIAFGGGVFNRQEKELFKKHNLSKEQVRQISGDDCDLVQLYTQAAAFVYPSLYEGFGLPPLEAMAAGCPVVTSNTSSMPEVIRQAGEYFNPNECEEMKHAIERVVYSSERCKELIELGYENIKDFSWEKCARETLKVYQNLIGLR